MPSQLVDEVREVLRFVLFMMKTFRLGYQMTLSTRPRKYIGSPENWERATQALTTALEKENIPFEVAQGEGAFYGPKIDVQMEDALGRLWQGPTIQVDFNLPERFDLTYIAPSGKKERVVMIHRVVLGTMERFIGILIEHWGGAFPVWLSPVQVRILTVTTKESLFAWQVYQKMMSEGIRVEVDDDNAMLGYKVRQAQLEKIPYMVIIGPREKEKEIITVRTRDGENLRGLEISEFIEMVKTKIKDKS